jgi:hypothetical protein
MANLPAAARKLRRSAPSAEISCLSDITHPSPKKLQLDSLIH